MARDEICCMAVLEAVGDVDPLALRQAWLADDPIAGLAPGARYRRSAPVLSDERGFRPKRVYGVAQVWVDGIAAASDLLRRLKGPLLKDTTVTAHAFRELALIDGPERKGGADGVRAFYFSTRKPGMSVEDFQAHWRDVHGPLVLPTPGISRYVQFYPCPETYGGELEPKYDSLAELTFPDKAAQAAFGASEHNTVHQRNDLPNLWDMTGGALRFYLERIDERPAAG
jgi:uncharacterized protein (TIGR02118 family)